jgi:hypothetical protein
MLFVVLLKVWQIKLSARWLSVVGVVIVQANAREPTATHKCVTVFVDLENLGNA